MKAMIHKTFTFESAHFLPHVEAGHKCGRMHGHSFIVDVYVIGEIDQKFGWVMDYADLKAVCAPVITRLDHCVLNDINGLDNPTSEILAAWMVEQLTPHVPLLSHVTVHETCTSTATVFVNNQGPWQAPAHSLQRGPGPEPEPEPEPI